MCHFSFTTTSTERSMLSKFEWGAFKKNVHIFWGIFDFRPLVPPFANTYDIRSVRFSRSSFLDATIETSESPYRNYLAVQQKEKTINLSHNSFKLLIYSKLHRITTTSITQPLLIKNFGKLQGNCKTWTFSYK